MYPQAFHTGKGPRRLRGAVRLWLASVGLALLSTSPAPGQKGPIIALPAYGTGGASDSYFAFSLQSGAGRQVDRLRRDPLSLRARRWPENLFQIVGRPTDQPALPGEIFLAPIRSSDGSVRAAVYVETSIGYVAYFDALGRGSKIGELAAVAGRPFEPILSTDSNYALLLRDDASGRTLGAYLYHATTGRGLYINGVNKLSITPKVVATSPLPALGGRIAAVPLHAGSEATASYLVVDPVSGDVHYFDLTSGMADQLVARKSPLNLYDALSREGSYTSARRFALAPVQRDEELTLHVLVFDAVTGAVAMIENVNDASASRLRPVTVGLDSQLRGAGGERVFTAIPNLAAGGQTLGVWVHDSESGRVVYVSNPGDPASLGVTLVAFSG